MSRYVVDTKQEKVYLKFLSRTDLRYNWCLSGRVLIHFVRNMSFSSFGNVTLGSCDKPIKVQPCDSERITVNLPVKTGEKLDEIDLSWTEYKRDGDIAINSKYVPKTSNGAFFNTTRKENARDLIKKMLECGAKAGIRDKMFLAFGNLLGYALVDDILWNDDDIDMNIMADDIPQEQLHRYLIECKNAGITEKRMKGPRLLNDKYVWFSIGEKPIRLNGVKACNWFWFKHGGYYWHSKGPGWRPTFAAKGIPLSIFDGKTKVIDFMGSKIKAPVNIGKCLDWWYGSWINEENRGSKETVVLQTSNPNDKSTWYIKRV